MDQPIWILSVGSDPTNDLCAEILRCEGFPWLEVRSAERFDSAPPDVRLLVVVGTGIGSGTAERLAKAVAGGVSLVALAPDPALAAAFGATVGGTVADARLSVTDLPRWEHGDVALLCPDDMARSIEGGHGVADLRDPDGRLCGAGVVRVSPGRGQAWLYGYDLCRTLAALRHGDGRLDCPPDQGLRWGGPRAMYSFLTLSEKLPHDVPVMDVHQDVLRSIVAEALSGTALPRLWHFPEAAPSLWFVRGDGCGEDGADFEVAVMEKYGAYLTFCRPFRSRYSGELMREWHARGHGISIEANINGITQPAGDDGSGNRVRRNLTAAELNAHHLPAIRANLEQHRDAFIRETGLEMETFMTHSAQWTGLPMAQMARELGWRTLLPFQSHDPRIRPGDRRGPYAMPTALPMRYFDREAGVLDLWHIPYQWIDVIFQQVAAMGREQGQPDPEFVHRTLGQNGEEYGAQVARFADDAARRWHVVQVCSFHPCYVASPRPVLGSSQRALEMGLEGARSAGCRFENLERWSRFFRARDGVRLVEQWTEKGMAFITLRTEADVEGLTLLVPDVVEIRLKETGEVLPVCSVMLEGRRQRAVVVDLRAGSPVTLCIKRSSRNVGIGN